MKYRPGCKFSIFAFMHILQLFVQFFILKLCSCAEVSTTQHPSNAFEKVPLHVLHIIGSYVNNPYISLGSLNRHFHSAFASFPLKLAIKERFKFLRIDTDTFDDNDEELKLLLDFSKFINSKHIYQALRYQFYNGNHFRALLLNFMKYFYRRDSNAPEEYKQEDLRVLTRKNRMEIIFQFGYVNFQFYIASILFNRESIRCLQKYLLTNPTHLNQVIDYLNKPILSLIFPFQHFSDWNEIALKWNLPDRFLVGNENHVVSAIQPHTFWDDHNVPRSLYADLYERVNVIINNHMPEDEKESYLILNLIRFGPDVPDFYESRIKNSDMRIYFGLLIEAASIANKKALLKELYSDHRYYFHDDYSFKYVEYGFKENDCNPIEKHKMIFDVHEFVKPEYLDQFYLDSNFIKVLSLYCRVLPSSG